MAPGLTCRQGEQMSLYCTQTTIDQLGIFSGNSDEAWSKRSKLVKCILLRFTSRLMLCMRVGNCERLGLDLCESPWRVPPPAGQCVAPTEVLLAHRSSRTCLIQCPNGWPRARQRRGRFRLDLGQATHGAYLLEPVDPRTAGIAILQVWLEISSFPACASRGRMTGLAAAGQHRGKAPSTLRSHRP